MVDLPEIISKKTWFVLFNVGTTIYMILSGNLHWDVTSIFCYGVALLLINFIAWISARKYKGWK